MDDWLLFVTVVSDACCAFYGGVSGKARRHLLSQGVASETSEDECGFGRHLAVGDTGHRAAACLPGPDDWPIASLHMAPRYR